MWSIAFYSFIVASVLLFSAVRIAVSSTNVALLAWSLQWAVEEEEVSLQCGFQPPPNRRKIIAAINALKRNSHWAWWLFRVIRPCCCSSCRAAFYTYAEILGIIRELITPKRGNSRGIFACSLLSQKIISKIILECIKEYLRSLIDGE